MAQFTFPIVPVGLVVDVLVNLDLSVLVPLRSRGTGPSPVEGRGLVDTGSDITAVALPMLQQLGIPAFRQTATQTLGGSMPVNLYRVSLHVLDAQNVALPWLSQGSLVVMELAPGFPFDVLLGLDVLLTRGTLVDGPARRFFLDC
jgi:Aspartyl protease